MDDSKSSKSNYLGGERGNQSTNNGEFSSAKSVNNDGDNVEDDDDDEEALDMDVYEKSGLLDEEDDVRFILAFTL